jgi:hypothetical protein
MARRKDISSEDAKLIPSGAKPIDNTKITATERRLHQDLDLTKGERTKGVSPAYAEGKKVERKERKG